MLAKEPRKRHPSFSYGVLELAGSTAFSVDYQKEQGSDREIVHLRLTPSLGYFISDAVEIGLRMSYIYEKKAESGVTDDIDQRFLFMLSPIYHFLNVSDFFVPYFGLGFGSYYQRVSAEQNKRSDLQFAIGLESGCRWMLTEQVAVKAGFQYTHGFREKSIDHTDYFGLEIGISLFIPTWPAY